MGVGGAEGFNVKLCKDGELALKAFQTSEFDLCLLDVMMPKLDGFMGGHVADSVNIPLNEVPQNLAEFKTMAKPIVLICASGMRSAQATQYLASQGIEQCYNGGSWLVVNGLV